MTSGMPPHPTLGVRAGQLVAVGASELVVKARQQAHTLLTTARRDLYRILADGDPEDSGKS